MAELSWRHALEHLPWLLILSPIAIAPLTVAVERIVRSRLAKRRAAHKRAGLGDAVPRLSAGLRDSHEPMTAVGTLRAENREAPAGRVAMSWFSSVGPPRSVHRCSDTRWQLELDDTSVALVGSLAVLAGTHETASGTPLLRALEWARLPDRVGDHAELAVEGQARVVHDGDRVRVRGVLIVEPSDGDSPESYRTRHLRARLVPSATHLQLVAERAPQVSLRPGFVRVARMTVMTAIAFAVIPALVVAYLQWMSMRSEARERHACESALEQAQAEHRPWDAAEPARRCGSREAKTFVAWHNGEIAEAAKHLREQQFLATDHDNHATNAASQIITGHYAGAAHIVRHMAHESAHRSALGCIAAGLSLMQRAGEDSVDNRDAAAELRRGAAAELRTLHATSDGAPIACIALLADRLREEGPLRDAVRAIKDGAAPGYYNSYLVALLAAETELGLSSPLLSAVVDAHHPPLAAQKPRSWALTHPVAVSAALLRKHPPGSAHERRIAAALAAQNALFDAFMGQEQVTVKTLKPVIELAQETSTPLRGGGNDAFIVGAAAAILADARVVAESLLQAAGPDDPRVAAVRARLALGIPPHDRSVFAELGEQEDWLSGSVLWRAAATNDEAAHASALAQTPISAVHGFIPFVALSLQPAPTHQWLTRGFPELCTTCGLRALAEHIAARRVAAAALGDPMAHHLAHPARRVHGAMLRREIAVPLYLLEWIVDDERLASEYR